MKEKNQPKENRLLRKTVPWWGWVLICLILVSLGILSLRLIGNLMIRAITQEIKIDNVETKSVEQGLAAPRFELSDLEGKKIKISDFLGTPVVITFWTTWNGMSSDQIKILDDYLAKNGGNTFFQILAINSQEDKSVVANFVARGGYKVKILLDSDGAVSELYKARNLPTTYFVDKKGIIRDIFVGLMDARTIVDKIGAITNK